MLSVPPCSRSKQHISVYMSSGQYGSLSKSLTTRHEHAHITPLLHVVKCRLISLWRGCTTARERERSSTWPSLMFDRRWWWDYLYPLICLINLHSSSSTSRSSLRKCRIRWRYLIKHPGGDLLFSRVTLRSPGFSEAYGSDVWCKAIQPNKIYASFTLYTVTARENSVPHHLVTIALNMGQGYTLHNTRFDTNTFWLSSHPPHLHDMLANAWENYNIIFNLYL